MSEATHNLFAEVLVEQREQQVLQAALEKRVLRMEAQIFGNGDSLSTRLSLLAQEIAHVEARRADIVRGIDERLTRQIDAVVKDLNDWKNASRTLSTAQVTGRWAMATGVLAALIAAVAAWLKK